ncbi:hypothetical protein Tco_0200679 [Tanacetum coccineum]
MIPSYGCALFENVVLGCMKFCYGGLRVQYHDNAHTLPLQKTCASASFVSLTQAYKLSPGTDIPPGSAFQSIKASGHDQVLKCFLEVLSELARAE